MNLYRTPSFLVEKKYDSALWFREFSVRIMRYATIVNACLYKNGWKIDLVGIR